MKTHELKLDTKDFDDVKSGKKNFEIRKNDRDFQVGDILKLKAWYVDEFGVGGYAKKHGRFLGFAFSEFAYTAEQADTITAKVTYVQNAVDFNKEVLQRRISKRISNKRIAIIKVLYDYFHTNRLSDDCVVLGIEVQE